MITIPSALRRSALVLLLSGCAPLSSGQVQTGSQEERIYITDRRGERFDITHAVRHYGMRPEGFEYGLGKGAIPALDHPGMSRPGDSRFPSPGESHQIIGLVAEGDARSYPLRYLRAHEVVNETIGHTQAAVAY
ncbi:MAG: DUF3179 domain-containing protein [Gemmatimonadetes bacterium]|nr:DUF3179 domain-containing protein [Gemmatimonadota bacterium]